MSQAKQDRLRREGKETDAEVEAIDHDTKKKKAALERKAKEYGVALGVFDSAGTPKNRSDLTKDQLDKWTGMVDSTKKQGDAIDKEAAEKKTTAGLKDFEKTEALKRDKQLEANQKIKDPYEREKADIKARYDYEVEVAKKAGKSIEDIETRRRTDTARLERDRAKAVTDGNKSLDEQIAEQKVRTTEKGLQAEFDLLELQRKKDRDNAKRDGLDPKKVDQLYDLREAALLKQQRIETAGTFSAASARAMGLGNEVQEEIKANTKDAAETLKRVEKIISGPMTYGI